MIRCNGFDCGIRVSRPINEAIKELDMLFDADVYGELDYYVHQLEAIMSTNLRL